MPPASRGAIALAGVLLMATPALAQPPAGVPPTAATPVGSTAPLFRIFLTDGTALATVGDSAVVGDRVVFTLAVGDGARHLQLMSLPLSSVDIARTTTYSQSIRAAHYAATRGESDYEVMTQEVSAALDYLTRVPDPRERLRLAEQARRRLLSWSRENYHYRADDIATLAGLFDEVIAELRASAGESSFTLDLSTGPAQPSGVPLLPTPTLRESIEAALTAARVADVPEDRIAILGTAAVALDGVASAADLRADVTRELDVELGMGEAYRQLADEVTARAETAADRGDVGAFEGLRADLDARDTALGRRRPAEVAAVRGRLDAAFERAVTRRLTLDRYVAARPRIYAYERAVRPALSGIDGLRPVLEHLRDEKFFNFQRLENAINRFNRLLDLTIALTPPDEVRDLHATITSALHMAQQAGGRRRLAVITKNSLFDREASAAAAGALMLADEARRELLARMVAGRAIR